MASLSDKKLHSSEKDDSKAFAVILEMMNARVAELEEKLVRKYEENAAALRELEVAIEKNVEELGDEIKASVKKQAEIASSVDLKSELSELCENRVKWTDDEKRRLERQEKFTGKQKTMNEQEKKAAELECIEASEKLTGLKSAMKFFEEDLALRLKKNKDGDMMFVFTNINPYDPEEEYSFSLNIDNDKVIVKECSPDVGDLCELVTKMNGKQDLGHFVCEMRQRFRDFSDGPLL